MYKEDPIKCRERTKKWRADHPHQNRIIRRNAEKRQYRDRLGLIQSLKSIPCCDCGIQYPHYVMEFDHVRGKKVDTMARVMSKSSIIKLLDEVDKCDVVCANCHRIRGWVRKHDNTCR